MEKYSNFGLIASFIGLWINSYFSDHVLIYVGFIFIFTFGILHGANDLALIKNLSKEEKKRSFSLKALAYYVAVILIGAIFFYFIPWLALSLFVVVSGYHFGEQQWKPQLPINQEIVQVLYQLIYGLLVLSLLFYFHNAEVQKIIFAISAIKLPLDVFLYFLQILLTIYGVLLLLIRIRLKSLPKTFVTALFYLMVFAILFKVSGLIWGFMLYFVFWHSIPSILDQIQFLFGDVTWTHFKTYLRSAYAYWILALASLYLVYYFLHDNKIFDALFFSFLAAITFPHVVVMRKMLQGK